jgi:hypothetical protein
LAIFVAGDPARRGGVEARRVPSAMVSKAAASSVIVD